MIILSWHLHSEEICNASAVKTAEINVPLDSAIDEVSLPVVRLTMGNRILAICNETFATCIAEELVITALTRVSSHILCGLDTIDHHLKRRDNDVARWLMRDQALIFASLGSSDRKSSDESAHLFNESDLNLYTL